MKKLKPIIVLLCIVGFLTFCVYAHRVREGWKDTKAEQQLEAAILHENIKDTALQNIPKESRNAVLLANVAKQYPSYKTEEIAEIIHVEIPKEEKTEEGGK